MAGPRPMSTVKIAETQRLLIRTIGLDDAPFYLALLNDPSFIDNIGDRGVRTLDDARTALSDGPLAMQSSLGHSIYIVELKDGATPIGMSGLIKRATLEDVDIGYAFLPRYCGQGYAYEAAVAVLAHARAIGIRRLVAITSPGNDASNRLLRKLGLRFQHFTHLTPDDPGTNLYACELDASEPVPVEPT
jgi:RimJ/RimL family protein N-acetyltransferase